MRTFQVQVICQGDGLEGAESWYHVLQHDLAIEEANVSLTFSVAQPRRGPPYEGPRLLLPRIMG
jgi:hypothetical protein